MHNISISLFINVDGSEYYFTGAATNIPPTPSCSLRPHWNECIDVPTRVVKEAKPMAKVIPLPSCKLLERKYG